MNRVLIIGVGSIGRRHVRCMLGTGRAEVGICEIDDRLRQETARQHDLTSVFGSLDEAVKVKWDAAVVATPAHTHIPISLQLAEAGVHLLIEKPLSTTLEGISSLIDKVAAAGLVAAVAYVYRAHPILAAMRQALRSGRFGQPVQIVAVCGQNFPFYRPAYRDTYYADCAKGGGAVQDALTHILNAGEWLVGPIDRLVADAAHQVLEGVQVEDTVHMITRHGSTMGCYSLNQHQAPNEITITVVCRKGTVRFELHENRWRWMTEPSGLWHDETFGAMERDEWFTVQENAFLDAVEGKAEPLCTLEEGLRTLKVNLAALVSVKGESAWEKIVPEVQSCRRPTE